MRKRLCLFFLLALALAPQLASVTADTRPVPEDRGASGLALALRRLQTIGSVLLTAAHPDDESTDLLAYAARGLGARAAYLSLNRGEGGQNGIGPELWDGLGIIRTEELLSARKLDGAEQYFTRAFDFGFTRSADETLAKWNREEVLGDMVRVIRMMRPLVVVNGNRRVAVARPGLQRVVRGHGLLRHGGVRNALHVEDRFGGLRPRRAGIRGEHEAEPLHAPGLLDRDVRRHDGDEL